ncbi:MULTISPECIES: YhgE/Pip domain-containing protein [Glutamicibacter]|uniref:YhgE/Pip domain-containing protein n=1 Tax=Glutamicibacter TaxID=1742989 RepID=UPI00155A011B|nr:MULTISPECIES: YhgE/Pip domain-containing protein [Glutamicibacter]MBF6671857.1 YhgE/Pip domain-containing protein [Glutamicibacter sp. FBE19]NQD39616.1 YhgE/Pip domain-containing protein [Glutamicibacter halophytocola]
MTTLQLALSELKRMTRGTLPKLALIALTCVPLLYGALYLYANWNPQGNLDKVTAAVVNLDDGAKKDGEFTRVGDDVVENLEEDGTFSWAHLDTRKEAEDAVASGEYAFALVLPDDFSAALVSPGDFKDADQADLELLTNDANNFMVSNFARTLAGEVRTSVSEEVGTETASAMIAGFVDIHSSMGDAADGAKKLYDGTLSLGDGVLTLADGTTKLVDGSSELSEGSVKLKDGTSQLSGGLQDLLAGQKKLSNGASDLADGTGELATGADKLSKGLQTMQAKTKSLPDSVSQLNDGTQSAKGAADQLATGSRQVADGNQQLATTADEAISVINQLQADTDQRLENVKTDAQAQLDQLVAEGTLSAEQAKAIKSTISQSVEESALPNALESKVDQVNSGLSSMQSKLHTLADGSEKVADGNQQLATGLGTLAEGTKKLDAAVPSLVDGISSAADGSAALATGAHSANDGAKKLAAGEKSALAGTSQAAGGAKALDEGAGTLVQGTDALHGGLVKLSDGVGDLSKGAGQLEDGSSQLSSGLDDGVKQVPNPDQKTSDQLADVIGSPVALDNVKQAEAQSYGAGLAPFFMTLATYIGVLVLTQVMRPITKRALLSNGSNWKISIGGWLPFAAIAVVQTSLLYAAVHFGLGLTTAHPWMAWLLLVCAALCFSALIQGFFALLGTAGKFLVLVLMVLQLITAGGTFPWETLPEPLQFLHQILPMGNVVIGMRHLVYGADLGVLSTVLGSLLIYTALGLLLSMLAVRKNKTWTLKVLQPELKE